MRSSQASAVRKSRYMLWMPVQRMGSGSQSFDRRLTTGECVNSVSRLSTRSTRVLAPRFAERDSMPGISGGRADSGLSIVTDRCTPCFNRHCLLTSPQTGRCVGDNLDGLRLAHERVH